MKEKKKVAKKRMFLRLKMWNNFMISSLFKEWSVLGDTIIECDF